MKVIAVVSTSGGAGRTTLTAALAVLCARSGRPTIALDLDAQNMLGAQLGFDLPCARGLAHALLEGLAWHAYAFRNADGVMFVPFGALGSSQVHRCDERLAAEPDWLAQALGEIEISSESVVLLDTARYPSQAAEQALRCADLVLCVQHLEPVPCAALAANLPPLQRARGTFRIVVNRLNPARSLQRDALAMLDGLAGSATVLKQRIHLDAALPEAFARGAWIFDETPGSQASHDLHGLANWLEQWLSQTTDEVELHAAVSK